MKLEEKNMCGKCRQSQVSIARIEVEREEEEVEGRRKRGEEWKCLHNSPWLYL